jgi:hypothetical protein
MVEGMWALSMREGEGEEIWKNGDKYTGMFSRDKMHGLGRYESPVLVGLPTARPLQVKFD